MNGNRACGTLTRAPHFVGAALAAAALLVLPPLAGGASAADTIGKGQRIFLTKAGCPFCHGWAGDGAGDPHSDLGPSLRTTQLDRDQIREVIQCGRPGTGMPHFDAFAYTDKRCYGSTREELGDQTPNDPPTALQQHEIDAVADYVAAKLKGAGPVTKEECVTALGAEAKECQHYPSANAALTPGEAPRARQALGG